MIFDTPTLFNKLFSILSEEYLNLTIAGYFSRVVQVLICRNPERALKLLKENNIFKLLFKHMYLCAIKEIILKIYTNEVFRMACFIEEKKLFINSTIKKLKELDECTVYFSWTTIIEFIKDIEDSSQNLIVEIYNENNIEDYFKLLISEFSYQSIAAANILANYFKIFLKNSFLKPLLEFVLICFDNYISQIRDLLAKPNNQLLGTSGETYEILGEGRLKIIELIYFVLEAKVGDFDAIIKSDVFIVITRIFFSIPWNTMLHSVVEKIVLFCASSNNSELIDAMLFSSNFFAEMIKFALLPIKKHRLGFIGNINRICNFLHVSECVEIGLRINNNEIWEQFCNGYLNEVNSIENMSFGQLKKYEISSNEIDIISTEMNQANPLRPTISTENINITSMDIYNEENYKQIEEKENSIGEILENGIEKLDSIENVEKIVYEDKINNEEKQKNYEDIKNEDESEN